MLTPLWSQSNNYTQYLPETSKPHAPEPPGVNTTVPQTTPTGAKTLSSMGQLWPEKTPRRLTKNHPDPEFWHTHMLHRPSLRHLQTHGAPTTLPLPKSNQHNSWEYSTDVCIPALEATSWTDLGNQQGLPHPKQALFSSPEILKQDLSLHNKWSYKSQGVKQTSHTCSSRQHVLSHTGHLEPPHH